MVIIIHGERGCGKTRDKHELAKHYNCRWVWDGCDFPSQAAVLQAGSDHLVLCLPEEADELKDRYMRLPGGVRMIPYRAAAKRAGITA